MAVNVPGLGVWPEHRMILHLWTDAPFLPAGERYGVLATLLQVDADGATATTIGQHVEEGDSYYTGDIPEPSVFHSILQIDVPQMIGNGLRLAVLLQAWTSSADPVLIELYVGGGWASCIETSLTAANGGAGGGGTTTILDSPDGSLSITPDGKIGGGGPGNTGGPADSLATTGAAVDVSAAAPPVAGQVLTATSATEASWQTPTSGGVTLPIAQSDVTGLTDALMGGVSTGRKVNGKNLSADITLTASDVGADASGAAAAITLAGLGGVPTTRQVAGHALSADITITAEDVGADVAGAAAAVTKTTLGLGNVDNTSDANKPVSTAQATAIGLKLDANDPISGATKTKITYDAKGLVTSGADATTADIADSSDKRYCTDAQKTVIGNTSGTNSGDETASGIKTKLGITTLSGSNTGDQTLPTDATIATTDVTTNDASTTKHGWQPKATAPAANQLAVVGIANGETVTTYKVIIGSTTPTTQAFGDSASHGVSLEAAPIDHKHGMPSAPSGITLPQAMIVASFRG
jgi:hypothetical protein